MESPVVFISYSHDSQPHKQWVLELATRLRRSGIDVILDQWDLGPGGDLPHFMEQSLARSRRILMICTERYVEKANTGLGGVGYEKMIVTADLLRQIGSNRVIPIVRQRGTVHLPTFLGSKMYIDLSTEDQFETGIDQLLRDLLNAPLFIKPPIGSALFEPVRGTPRPTNPPPVLQFMQALAKVYERSNDAGAVRTEWVRPVMETTKLFFDHAFDQAVALKYVDCSPDKQIIWVQNAGRDFLINLASNDPSAA